ncbi:MAG: selenoprotein B glycine/betaine/sarcosine/D-proline reductase [Betaproteobacteria bacterium]|nr:selenoprotein B glycine/betaine/sarcosine/D-proline reductase [Betaproteobacteria bacterium]
MVRLADLTAGERDFLLGKLKDLSGFDGRPWVTGPAIDKRRVAIVTTAGIHRLGDRPFADGAAASDYRVIPGSASAGDLVMSHLSSNFDRTGFQQDVNVVFPIDRLRELAAEGVIGAAADYHYAFMGAAPPRSLEPKARELAVLLKKDRVDAALLTPV